MTVIGAFFHNPWVALIIHVSNTIEPNGEFGSGPYIGIVGGMGLYSDEVGVEVFGMNCTVASHDDFGILGDASQGHQRGAIIEVVFHHIAVEGQVDVTAAFVDVEVERTSPNGVDDGIGGINGKLTDASDRVGA